MRAFKKCIRPIRQHNKLYVAQNKKRCNNMKNFANPVHASLIIFSMRIIAKLLDSVFDMDELWM